MHGSIFVSSDNGMSWSTNYGQYASFPGQNAPFIIAGVMPGGQFDYYNNGGWVFEQVIPMRAYPPYYPDQFNTNACGLWFNQVTESSYYTSGATSITNNMIPLASCGVSPGSVYFDGLNIGDTIIGSASYNWGNGLCSMFFVTYTPPPLITANFTGNGAGLTNLNASSLASGTLADARLSANVALLNSSPAFSTPVTMSSFLSLARTTIVPADGGTLSPAGSYVLFNPAAAVVLNAVTAITSGSRTGDVLILQGNSDMNTVTVPNNANTRLTAASHVLGANDMLVLMWTGAAWTEVSFANN